MAEDRNPETVAVGIDIELAAAEVHLLVNDVPTFDPADPFGGEEQITTQLRLNNAFRKGRNTVQVRVRMLPGAGMGYAPALRIDFGYWPLMSQPFMFDGRPMAASLSVTMDAAGGQAMSADAPSQPLMQVTPPVRLPGAETGAASWQTYSFDVELDIDLPEMAWMGGQNLSEVKDLRNQVLAHMQRVHTAMGAGPAAAFGVLEPFVARNAAAVGSNAQEMFAYSLQSTFDGSEGYQPVPFSIENAEMRFFGGGRLVTFVPTPHRFFNAEEQQNRAFALYHWKDAQGQWQVIH